MCFLSLTPLLAAERSVRIEKGQPAPYTGYLFSVEYGKQIAEGWSKAEADAKTWENAYKTLKSETEESLNELKHLLNSERKTVNATVRKLKRKNCVNILTYFLIGGVVGAIAHNNN